MKMTTPIPEEITTLDTVETRLGTLNFKNGIADREAVEKIYDNIDFARAVDVYLVHRYEYLREVFKHGL